MRILIYSPAFLPQVGGLEINTSHTAEEIVRQGHEVLIVTSTRNPGADCFPFRVVRNPSPWQLLRWTRWCDVVLHQNISLRGLWPLLLVRRPWVVSHHSWYCRSDGRLAWQDRLKRFLLRFADGSIAVSQSVADDLAVPTVVIPNAYRDKLFHVLAGTRRRRELLFVGRLVSDKGVDLLLDAMGRLAAEGLRPDLTLVGDGPERPALAAQAESLGLAPQIEILGTRTDEELVRIFNEHRILVVPSRYNEPFGIVALEGIACGCLVVGSEGGGLKAAIGPCGITFRNGDAAALTAVLSPLLRDPAAGRSLLERAPDHLAGHTAAVVGRQYLQVLERAVAGGRRR